MRKVISLSLPEQATKQIRKQAKCRGFLSVSSYVKHLVEMDTELISEEELWKSVLQARADYKKGKAISGSSMAELL